MMRLPGSRPPTRFRAVLLAAPLLLIAALAACSSGGSGAASTAAAGSGSGSGGSGSGGSGGSCPYTFAVITHGDNGSFWSVVYKGAKDAANQFGCKLSEVYGSQQQGQAEPDDNAENSQIQDAINAHVSGIAVSDHDPSLMNPTIAKAVAAGIPVVLLNSGCDSADLAATHAITCVGQPEQVAGAKAGGVLASQGATNALCVIHQSGQNLLDRCNGVAQALGTGTVCKTGNAPSSGPGCTELILSTPNAASNPQQADQQIVSYLQAHPGVNSVVTLNDAIAGALVPQLATSAPKVKVGTFDLNGQVVSDIRNGSIDFAIDQQQYLQGYLPVQALYIYLAAHGNSVSPGAVLNTGPLVVNKSNISAVAAAISSGDD